MTLFSVTSGWTLRTEWFAMRNIQAQSGAVALMIKKIIGTAAVFCKHFLDKNAESFWT